MSGLRCRERDPFSTGVAGLGIAFDERGEHQLKGAPDPWTLYAVIDPGGSFVIEVLVPGLRRLPPGETFQPFDVSPTHLGFDEYDVARQGVVSHHYSGRGRQGRGLFAPVSLRVAVGARPDGQARRDDPARTVRRLEARAVHE